MTFEEFFYKKRINLAALQAAEPGLYAEFEKHFAAMGEKSFDHTKKYWFNKLRLQYHLAPEKKPEKMHQENQLAEQTIVETLTETITMPGTGFKPRFKPGMAAKPGANTSDVKDPAPQDSATATPEVNQAAASHTQNPPFEQEKAAMQASADATPRTTDGEGNEKQTEAPVKKATGFKPRFNSKMTAGTSPQTKEFKQEGIADDTSAQQTAKTGEPVKPAGFNPRFKAKVATSEPDATKPETDLVVNTTPGTEDTAPKPAFKPRFNAKTMAQKPAPENPQDVKAEQATNEDKPTDAVPVPSEEQPVAAKPGFKPRFNIKMVKPGSAETNEQNAVEVPQQPANEKPSPEQKPAGEETSAAPKVGFKPRFNAKTTKPQPPQE